MAMRILIVGATGTIGRAVAAALHDRHELVLASRQKSHEQVDISDPASIRDLYRRVGKVDAVVSAAGSAAFKPLAQLGDEDFAFSVANKLMGQINLVRFAGDAMNDGGSFTLTGGVIAHEPAAGASAVGLVNAGLEGFARSAALDLQRGQRINIVSPPWVSETLTAMGRDTSIGTPAADVARAYVGAVEGKMTGQVIQART